MGGNKISNVKYEQILLTTNPTETEELIFREENNFIFISPPLVVLYNRENIIGNEHSLENLMKEKSKIAG